MKGVIEAVKYVLKAFFGGCFGCLGAWFTSLIIIGLVIFLAGPGVVSFIQGIELPSLPFFPSGEMPGGPPGEMPGGPPGGPPVLGTPPPTATPEAIPTPISVPGAVLFEEGKVYAIGQPVQFGNWVVAVEGVDFREQTEFYHFVVIKVSLTPVGEVGVPGFHAELRDAEGERYIQGPMGKLEKALKAGEMRLDQALLFTEEGPIKGMVIFDDVPKTSTGLVLTFKNFVDTATLEFADILFSLGE